MHNPRCAGPREAMRSCSAAVATDRANLHEYEHLSVSPGRRGPFIGWRWQTSPPDIPDAYGANHRQSIGHLPEEWRWPGSQAAALTDIVGL